MGLVSACVFGATNVEAEEPSIAIIGSENSNPGPLTPPPIPFLSQDRVGISPLGATVELVLQTASDSDYVLESQAVLMEGKEWAPLMQFRGSTSSPRNWIDPVCGDSNAKFFRLRALLAAPPVEVSNFRLLDVRGEAHELYYHWPVKGVVVLLVGDDFNQAIEHRAELDSLRMEFGEEELLTWVVSLSDVQDRPALLEASEEFPVGLPVLQDISHSVTRTLGTGVSPEAILVDPLDWSIAYRGPVQVTIDTGAEIITQSPLREAVTELFAGAKPSVSRLAALGEPAGVGEVMAADYSQNIAPLLQANCFPCHTPGDIAPWAMTDYDTVVEYSRLIKSAVLAGEMPPWHADPAYQAFSNAKAMSPDEVAMLVDWIDRGMPRGDGPDPLAETEPPAPIDWPLGTPDAIISIEPQSVPATGTVDYRYLFAQSPFPSDVWLRAVSVKPGDRSVVHHCLVFKGTFAEIAALQGGLSGFFAGYVPGMEDAAFPEGTGKQLRRSDIIVFQMHYTVSGTATTDVTQLGLYLADAPPEKPLITSSAFNVDFVIPPNAQSVAVSATKAFPTGATLYEFSPHMHYRGSSSKFVVEFPDGSEETVLNVPSYFFDWQALYRLEQPISIPPGSVLRCEGTFDNSIQNRFNPGPSDEVRFGEQSWEEMFIGYVNYTEN